MSDDPEHGVPRRRIDDSEGGRDIQSLLLWRVGRLEEAVERNTAAADRLTLEWERLPHLYVPRAEQEARGGRRLQFLIGMVTILNVAVYVLTVVSHIH